MSGEKLTPITNKPSLWALSPLLVFLCLYLVTSIIVDDFYKVPITVAFMVSSVYAVCITKGLSLNERMLQYSIGAANKNIMLMIWIFILAGAFAQSAKDIGAIDATVNLTLLLLPDNLLLAGIFLAACFISLSIGTSVGTIVALVPVVAGIADKIDMNLAFMVGVVVGGAFFGDNLSFISDTTIAATRTQGCGLRDKFRVNFLIALPAAVLTIVILLVVGRPESAAEMGDLSFSIAKVLPYLAVLGLALAGVNVFLTLTIGIFGAGIIGIAAGDLTVFTLAQNIWNGFTGMSEIFFLALFCGGLSELIAHNGGIVWLIEKLRRMMRGHKSAQLGIAALVSLADCATANNTVAIIVSGNVARDVSREYKVDPRRTASLLDVFSCVFQGLLPYGAQLLTAATLTTTTFHIEMSPVEIVPYMWYCWILAAFGLLSIAVPYADGICRKNPWNWTYDVAESDVAAKKAMEEKRD